jgi:hypothetical protein
VRRDDSAMSIAREFFQKVRDGHCIGTILAAPGGMAQNCGTDSATKIPVPRNWAARDNHPIALNGASRKKS